MLQGMAMGMAVGMGMGIGMSNEQWGNGATGLGMDAEQDWQ